MFIAQDKRDLRTSVADLEFHNGRADGRGKGSGEGAVPPPQKKIEFLPENGGFWCILGLLFTFMQKLVRPMGAGGGRPPPSLDPPLENLIKLMLGDNNIATYPGVIL